MGETTATLFYKYRNWYYLWVELSGWVGSVTNGLGADLSLPPCLSVTTGIWNLTHKSDLRAEISGSIVWYDALAPCPEVLLSWCFVRACAASFEFKCWPYSWGGNMQPHARWSWMLLPMLASLTRTKDLQFVYENLSQTFVVLKKLYSLGNKIPSLPWVCKVLFPCSNILRQQNQRL